MSADNFDKKPDNSINQDEELTAILQRLSSLLDKSVSLDDAIELAKKQSSDAPLESETVTETVEETSEQDNTETKNTEDIVELLEQEEENAEESPVFEAEAQEAVTTEDAVVEEETVIEEETTVEEENVAEPEETEEDEQPDKSMPVSDFIKLLKTKRFTDEAEQPEVTEEQSEVTEDTSTDEEIETVEEKAEVETALADNETSVEEEIKTEETVFENEAELVTEKKPLIEEITDTQETVTEEDTVTSKIFDELLACFDDRKLPDDFRFSDVNSKEETEPEKLETETAEEETEEEQTEETEQEPTPEFVPIEHENPEEDELFSKIFSEEKSERKNREKDKKKWQNQGNEPSPFLSGLYDWLEVIVLSAAFALLLFTFILRIAIVDGDSMNHTLHDKELLIISDLMYTPDNNDIIVFTSPNYPEPIVKRVIATEGQTVDIDFDTWTVTVDGKVLKEDYINRVPGIMNSSDVAFPLTVPEGYVFVMGDNRNESLDSRNSRIGFVDERFILGEVKLRLFPIDRFGTVD